MVLNKQRGNMYDFVTHTWNPIRGECHHRCNYCYMNDFNVGEMRIEKKELNTNLGEGNRIFVGSSIDMWSDIIHPWWIKQVLEVCKQYDKNEYLFQTKSPHNYYKILYDFPKNSILGVTIESNIHYPNISNAPEPWIRAIHIKRNIYDSCKRMVTIEPIMDFNFRDFVSLIWTCNADWVNVGADTRRCNLPEPSSEKINRFINEISLFTKVRIKKNLTRLCKCHSV